MVNELFCSCSDWKPPHFWLDYNTRQNGCLFFCEIFAFWPLRPTMDYSETTDVEISDKNLKFLIENYFHVILYVP